MYKTFKCRECLMVLPQDYKGQKICIDCRNKQKIEEAKGFDKPNWGEDES